MQYMVVYQCIVTATGNLAFYVDGSSYSTIQASQLLPENAKTA